jgi:protein-S-isoprenylcysteine O-methyltransferase Ste14
MGSQFPWYRGTRGEWYVVAQMILMALVFFGPRGAGAWRFLPTMFGTGFGLLLILIGGILLPAGVAKIGKNRTALPHPKEGSILIQTGPYRIVRHPMYSGGLMIALGFALITHSWLTLCYVLILYLFLDIKSRREERWLIEKFPEYKDYQKRVKKLVPGVY